MSVVPFVQVVVMQLHFGTSMPFQEGATIPLFRGREAEPGIWPKEMQSHCQTGFAFPSVRFRLSPEWRR